MKLTESQKMWVVGIGAFILGVIVLCFVCMRGNGRMMHDRYSGRMDKRMMSGEMMSEGMMHDMKAMKAATSDSAMHGAMMNMMAGLEGKTGDAFDQAFLAEMIVHHEGAVDMAKAALASAKHEEIKNLAKEIIAAQTKEIADMKAWQSAWYANQ